MTPRTPRPTGKSTSKSTGASARRPSSGRSTAGKAAPRRPTAKAAPKPARGSRATNRLVVLLIVIGALVISYGSSLRTYLRLNSQKDQLRASIANLQAEIKAEKDAMKRGSDPAYIEQQARLRFGWVLPGQTPYVVLGADGQPLDNSSELNASPPTVSHAPVAWWTKETSSLLNADNPPAPPKTEPSPSKKINGG